MPQGAVLVKPNDFRRKQPNRRPGRGTFLLTGIVTDKRFFHLKKPIRISETRDRGLWVHECGPLKISAYARTPQAAWRAFVTQFESTWDWIAQEKDSMLNTDARVLKRRYLDLVEKVEPVL